MSSTEDFFLLFHHPLPGFEPSHPVQRSETVTNELKRIFLSIGFPVKKFCQVNVIVSESISTLSLVLVNLILVFVGISQWFH